MPPTRWKRPTALEQNEANKTDLLRYIKKYIEDNNFLGLLGDELDNMVSMLATCKTRLEVYDWCQTLMVGELLAAEVIKRRTDRGPPFEEDAQTHLTPPAASCSPSGEAKSRSLHLTGGKKRADRRRNGAPNPNTPNPAALRPGFEECGCFATTHALRGNCANCGRIICAQESDATCYACGLDPSTCLAYAVRVQEGLLSAAAQERDGAAYEAAIARRDALLHFAATRTARTTVVDDQSAALFAPRHAWMSLAERESADADAALAERRRKVAAMHRHTGAYKVHLDIMQQNVSLSPSHALPPPSPSPSPSLCETEETEETEETSHLAEVRAVPLPSLMQKIWYSLDGSAATNAGDPATSTAHAARGEEEKTLPNRRVELSRRVQQDYFEEDIQHYRTQHGERVGQRQNEDGLHDADPNDSAAQRMDALHTSGETRNEKDEEDNSGRAARDDTNPETPQTDRTHEPHPITQHETEEKRSSASVAIPNPPRFAPTAVMRMNDGGVCLSMHQPWASLLVGGIKTHEGRNWSTPFRGRLWIHAASALPHDVAEVEQHYSRFMSANQQLPKHYPTRVLLGYVYLAECLDRSAYEAAFSPEERQEESPFSFICVEAKALPFPLPMEGKHKLFQMERRIHTSARKQLMELS